MKFNVGDKVLFLTQEGSIIQGDILFADTGLGWGIRHSIYSMESPVWRKEGIFRNREEITAHFESRIISGVNVKIK